MDTHVSIFVGAEKSRKAKRRDYTLKTPAIGKKLSNSGGRAVSSLAKYIAESVDEFSEDIDIEIGKLCFSLESRLQAIDLGKIFDRSIKDSLGIDYVIDQATKKNYIFNMNNTSEGHKAFMANWRATHPPFTPPEHYTWRKADGSSETITRSEHVRRRQQIMDKAKSEGRKPIPLWPG